MATFRTKTTQQKYDEFRMRSSFANGCALCKEKNIKKKFKYWRILKTKFPLDNIAKISHLIIPLRHTTYEKLNKAEQEEFKKIKSTYIEKKYEIMIEATNKKKSIPEHFHIHLIVAKN